MMPNNSVEHLRDWPETANNRGDVG